tara:strand:- start:120 stop:278 length:159 start_codon:yes stop_codon:yes gene_type:complete
MYVEALKIAYNDEEYLDLVEKYWQSHRELKEKGEDVMSSNDYLFNLISFMFP